MSEAFADVDSLLMRGLLDGSHVAELTTFQRRD